MSFSCSSTSYLPHLMQQNFDYVKHADVEGVRKLCESILQRPDSITYLSAVNPKKPNSEKTLLARILKRTVTLQAQSSPMLPSLVKTLRGLRSPTPLLYPSAHLPDSPSDISVNLLEEVQLQRVHHRYRYLIDCFENSNRPSSELLTWSPQQVRGLFDKIQPGTTSELQNFWRLPVQMIVNPFKAQKEGQALLQKAIRLGHLNKVRDLLSLGVQTENFHLLEAHANVLSEPANVRLRILQDLYKVRNPLFVESFYQLIFQVLQSYHPPTTKENKIYNHNLLDAALSSLLGVEIKIKNVIEFRGKYHGHLLELQGEDPSAQEPENRNLEGFYAWDYFSVHLRLFFQQIIDRAYAHREEIQPLRDDHGQVIVGERSEVNEQMITEFLCELEIGWLIHRHHNLLEVTRGMNGPIKESLRERFKEILVEYTLRQIQNIPEGSEYVVYTLLPMHCIYVAFEKQPNQEIRIRIDNLGLFYNIGPRHIATVSVNDPNLRDYLRLLFETTQKSYELPVTAQTAEPLGMPFARRIYNLDTPLFRNPQLRKNYSFPPIQSVGNCTHYSFLLGQSIRLGNEEEDPLLHLIPVMENAKKLSNALSIPSANSPAMTFSDSYKGWIGRRLFNRYFILEANSSQIPFMRCDQFANTSLMDRIHSSHDFRFFVRGAAGMGKTTFCQQLAMELQADEKLNGVIFYLPLRKLIDHPQSAGCELIDLVEMYVLQHRAAFYERSSLTALVNDRNTIWILDGFDELIILPHLEKALKELFHRNKIILTSRPHFSMQRAEQVIELNQFTQSEIRDYSIEEQERLIESLLEKGELMDRLKNILQASPFLLQKKHPNPQLHKLCKAPLSLMNVCELLASGEEQILHETNIVAINERFVDLLQKNAHKKLFGSVNPASKEEIRAFYTSAIGYMEKLAFQSLEYARNTHFPIEFNHRVLPRDPSYRKKIENQCRDLGLIQLDQGGGQFIHASYQEYFAARYLVRKLKKQGEVHSFQNVKAFIERHKNSPEYDGLFLCMTQIFQKNIERSEGKKKQDQIFYLLSFLRLCFPEEMSNIESSSSSSAAQIITRSPVSIIQEQQTSLLSLINVVYEIVGEVEEVRDFAQHRIQPVLQKLFREIKFNAYSNPTLIGDLQQLIGNHPQLKRDCLLDDLVAQVIIEIERSGQDGTRNVEKIDWVRDFVNHFDLSLSSESMIRFLSYLKDRRGLDSFNIEKTLKLLALSRLEAKLTLPKDLADLIEDSMKIALQTYRPEYFKWILQIEEKIPQVNLIVLCAMLPKIDERLLSSYSFFSFTQFLIDYTAECVRKRRHQVLNKIVNLFEPLFERYTDSTKTEHTSSRSLLSWDYDAMCWGHSEIYKALLTLRQTSTGQDISNLISEKIFTPWDKIVVPADIERLCNSQEPPIFLHVLSSAPPIITFFSFSGESLKNRILEIVKGSLDSNKVRNRNRSANWYQIGRFLANRDIVNRMDQENPQYVHDIIEFMLQQLRTLDIHPNSQLTGEIIDALKQYTREDRTPYDDQRIARIKENFERSGSSSYYSVAPQVWSPAPPAFSSLSISGPSSNASFPQSEELDSYVITRSANALKDRKMFKAAEAIKEIKAWSNRINQLERQNLYQAIQKWLEMDLANLQAGQLKRVLLDSLQEKIGRNLDELETEIRELSLSNPGEIQQMISDLQIAMNSLASSMKDPLQKSGYQKELLSFDVDLSYYGYAETLSQLDLLASRNPGLFYQLMTPDKKIELENLNRSLLEIPPSTREFRSIGLRHNSVELIGKLLDLLR